MIGALIFLFFRTTPPLPLRNTYASSGNSNLNYQQVLRS